MEISNLGAGLLCAMRKLLPLQLRRVVKLTAILLTIFCLHVSARSFEQTVSFSGKNVPLQTVFASIEKQTGISFFFNYSLMQDIKPVTLDIKNVTLEQAINEVLKGLNLTYYREGKTVFIVKKRLSSELTTDKTSQEARMFNVRGKVVNQQGEGLVGASVVVKNGEKGGVTDEKGFFFLKSVPENAVLDITYAGYLKKEIVIKDDQNLTVQLILANNKLDEAQVIAYGNTTQRFSTGDVTTVTSEEIQRQPVSNPLLALEGRVPGVFITQTAGVPGSGVSILIQGQNSIQYGNDPFYVVDGIPFSSQLLPSISGVFGTSNSGGVNNSQEGNPLNYINPQDIESISILKGADATAIYGSRAANGAIIITTKKGKAGRNIANIDYQQGIGQITRKVKLLNTQQYLQMRNEAFNNDGTTPSLANGDYDLLFWDTTRYTDWQKALIGKTSAFTNLSGSFSGGNAFAQYLVSGTYRREGSVMPGDFNDTKGAIHLNLNTASENQKFRMQLSSNYMFDDNKLPNADLTQTAIQLAPDAPQLYNKDGTLNWAADSTGVSTWPVSSNFVNPLAYTYVTYENQTKNFVSSLSLSYRLLRGLEIKANGGYTDIQTNETVAVPLSSVAPQNRPFSVSQGLYGNNNINSWIIEPQISYKGVIGKGKIDLLVGSTIEQNNSKSMQFRGLGFTSDVLIRDPSAASQILPNATTLFTYKYNAVFTRIGYNWDDKYLLNITGRRDGSSRFGVKNQFHDFGAVGVGWIFSNESLVKNHLGFISFGKLRGSYGTTGNDQIGNYQYLSTYTTTYAQLPYQGVAGLQPSGLSNPSLQWEETKKLEIGADLGVLKDRVLLSANYFRNLSSNQLLSYNLPITTGFNSIQANFPATVENTGWELSIHVVNIKKSRFNWSSAVNLTIPRNKLKAFPDLASSSYANNLVIGKPVNIVKAYHALGVNDSSGVYEYADSKGNPTYNPNFATDFTRLIDINPKYYGGLQNTFSYDGITLDFLLQYVRQIAPNYTFGYHPGLEGFNQPTSVLNRWQKPGDQQPVEKYTAGYGLFSTYYYQTGSDAYYSDASFLRLKNLSLSWEIPRGWTKRAGLQNGRIYLLGQNLLTVTKYSGLDPESKSLASLPPLKVITFGVQVSL